MKRIVLGAARLARPLSVVTVIVAWCFAARGPAPAYAADLDANQRKFLADAQNHLKQLNSNLKLAQDAAGPGEGVPPASKARLAATRLGSAKQSQAEVKARLERLPADHPDVKALQAEYDAAAASVTALENRLTGKSSAAAPGGQKPGGGMKLDPRQQEALKNATFHVTNVEGYANGVAEVAAKVKAASDPTTVDRARIRQAMTTIETARRKQADAEAQLAKVPADGEGVADVAATLRAAVASLAESEKLIAPVHEKLAKMGDASNYAGLEGDVTRLRELALMYGDPLNKLRNDRADAVVLVQQIPATRDELKRMSTTYAPLIAQQNGQGRSVEGGVRYLTERLDEFDAAAQRVRGELPQEVEADLAKVRAMTDTAVNEQRPAYFTQGIPSHLRFTEEKVALLEVLDPEAGKGARQKLADARADIKARQASLLEGIVNANELPKDQYAGKDKETLKAAATDAWKKLDPAAEVLAVRFPSKDWDRETKWRYQNREWYRIDRSKLQAQLIVRRDDKLAAIQPVDLWIDHMDGDRLITAPMNGKDDEVIPQNLLLLSKVKP